ncbi:MAG: DMT family transporter [Acidimicrobiales bacterium]
MFLWAICFPLILAGLALAPHLAFAALRAFVAGAALIGTAVALGRPRPTGTRTWLLLVVAGVGATTLGFLGMFHAAEFIAPGMATVIANTQPLMAAVLAYFVLAERLSRRGVIGLGMGFVGIAIIAAPALLSSQNGDNYALGIAYVLLAAVGITLSNVALKHLAGEVDALWAAGAQLLIGMIPLIAISALTESPGDINWSPTFVLALLGLALPGTAVVYWLWMSVLETMPLSRANAFTFLVPIFGLSMGIAFYGEALTVSITVGAFITLAGVALVNRSRPTLNTEPAPLPTQSGPADATSTNMEPRQHGPRPSVRPGHDHSGPYRPR